LISIVLHEFNIPAVEKLERRRNLFWFNTLPFERLKTEEEEEKTLIWFHFQCT